MTILTEGKDSYFMTAPALLIEDSIDTASWASKYVTKSKHIKWVLGKYVEADNANNNGQYWEYADLRMAQPTITYSAMNVDHRGPNVGTWVATEMMHPTDNDNVINPYIEALGAFWKLKFPNQLKDIEAAYEAGNLYISMECNAETVTCVGSDVACGQTFPYDGPASPTYCSHIQSRAAARQLNHSTFIGGALIVPPNKPGWRSANVKDLAGLTTDDEKNKILVDIADAAPGQSPAQWERTMWAIQEQALMSLVQGN